VTNDRILTVKQIEPPRSCAVRRWSMWPLVISVAVLVGSAVALDDKPRAKGKSTKDVVQAQPAKDPKEVQPAKDPAQPQPAQNKEAPASTCGGSAGTAPAQASGCGANPEAPQAGAPKGSGGPQPAGGGAGAKWVCPETTLNVPPLWRGEEIECAWMIRNEGTGNLDIKASGG